MTCRISVFVVPLRRRFLEHVNKHFWRLHEWINHRILTMLALQSGPLRFSEVRRKVDGISEKMLAQTLKALEQYGLVSRHSYEVVPPHVEYSLTEFGLEAASRLFMISSWIEEQITELVQEPDVLRRE